MQVVHFLADPALAGQVPGIGRQRRQLIVRVDGRGDGLEHAQVAADVPEIHPHIAMIGLRDGDEVGIGRHVDRRGGMIQRDDGRQQKVHAVFVVVQPVQRGVLVAAAGRDHKAGLFVPVAQIAQRHIPAGL